jgi:chemotaxis protein histidine kinase CheA
LKAKDQVVKMSSVVEIVEMPMFNASIAVTELLMKTLENCAKDLASRCISEAAMRHGFNAEEEIRTLGLENLALIRKQMAKKSVAKGEKKEKKPREKVVKDKKSVFPMPFVAELVDIAGCQGLAYNRGLFTQCSKKRMENGSYCNGCQSEADKNASGCPDCGTCEARLATGLYEFKDPKGRSPVSYVKVLDKLKLSQDAALEEAGKLNIEIPEDHFVVVEKSKKTKGRPKKTGAVEADNVTDLFAKLSSEGEGDEEEAEEGEDSAEQKPVKASKKAKLSDEEKAAKKAALEEERALKKAEREAKLAEEKAEKEAKRKAEAELKKAEREAKIAQEKAEREAKRAQEKALAQQQREAKKAAEKAAKEAEKASKGKKSVAKAEAVEKPVANEPAAPAPAPAKVSVTRMQVAGKTYLKSSTNILYDPATKEEVGLWDPETKTIKDLPEDDEEVEEEDYESDA